ncbi:MAG: hypothetical protein ACOZCL_10975 [Bacillota bacterium]
MKRPIYKRWWFWVIIAAVVIGIMAGGNNTDENIAGDPAPQNPKVAVDTPEDKAPPAPPQESVSWLKAGMYKIGDDIQAGEYFLMADEGQYAYFQLSKDSTGSLESIITNDNFSSSRYITAAEGQYLEVVNAKLISVDKAPIQAPVNGAFQPGMYKVGRDIEAGEYKVIPEAGGYAYYEVAKDSTGSLGSIVTNDNFTSEKYVTVQDGQYIKINDCTITR